MIRSIILIRLWHTLHHSSGINSIFKLSELQSFSEDNFSTILTKQQYEGIRHCKICEVVVRCGVHSFIGRNDDTRYHISQHASDENQYITYANWQNDRQWVSIATFTCRLRWWRIVSNSWRCEVENVIRDVRGRIRRDKQVCVWNVIVSSFITHNFIYLRVNQDHISTFNIFIVVAVGRCERSHRVNEIHSRAACQYITVREF